MVCGSRATFEPCFRSIFCRLNDIKMNGINMKATGQINEDRRHPNTGVNSIRTTMRFILLYLTLLLSVSVYSCDCGPMPSMETAIGAADIVVHARVIKAEFGKPLNQDRAYLDSLAQKEQRVLFGPIHVNEYTLIVLRSFKGSVSGDTLILRTGLDPVTDCGLLLTVGSEVVLYANKVSIGQPFYDHSFRNNILTTSACSRTRPFNRKEVRQLRKRTA